MRLRVRIRSYSGSRKSLFNRLHDRVRILEPVLGQDYHNIPAEVAQQARSKDISLQKVGVLIIRVGIDHDSKAMATVTAAPHGEIATEVGLADIDLDFVPTVAQLRSELNDNDIRGRSTRSDAFGGVYLPEYAACR